jgi:acetolactate synthase I/II/III large subunit
MKSVPPASASSPGRPSRVVDVVLQFLKGEGVRVVFGIPGGLLYPFFDAVETDPDLALIVTKHEEGAAFMADGLARASGRLSVCAGTSGPGSTNLLTGVSCAFADGVPMLVLTGQAASHAMGKGAAQETSREDMDIVAMFRPVTKYSAMVTSAQTVAMHLRRALREALTGRPGPVHLNFPVDLWERPLEESWLDPKSYRPDTRTFDREAVKAATQALMNAKHPVILAGAGVAIAGAQQHLIALAELLPARVATSPRGKGVFPEDHPLSLGVFGVAGHRSATDTLLGSEVDVLLTAGTSLSETSTLNWDPRLSSTCTLIQLDIVVDRIGRNYPVDIPLVGDAQTVLVELIYHAHRSIREGARVCSQWANAPPVPSGASRYLEAELMESDARPLTPQRWRRDLMEVLPDDAIVFSDIGAHMLFNIHYLKIGRGQRFIINLGFGSMGHGTVAPIGAALAQPARPVIAIIGDGCFAMNGMELLTASENDLPVLWLVEHNNMHAITWHVSQTLANGRAMQAALFRRPLEVAAIARAMGLQSWVVDAPGTLQGAVREALATRRPSLIEVRVDARIPPPAGARARSLAGFIER